MTSHAGAPPVIADRNSRPIKQIRALQQRDERERTGLFFTEGLRFVARATRRPRDVRTLVVAPRLLTNPFGRRLVAGLTRRGTPLIEVTPEVWQSLAPGGDPRGIGAVVRQRWDPLAGVDPARGLCWVALAAVQSPGNLGSILRTCEAVGAAGLILVGDAVDPYDPAAVRATMGAIFNQRLVRTTAARLAAWRDRHGVLLAGTSPSAAVEYRSVVYRPPLVLFMGWERQGLSPEHQALCDLIVRIPMTGESDSLNLSVATAVVLYEVFHQRRQATGP